MTGADVVPERAFSEGWGVVDVAGARTGVEDQLARPLIDVKEVHPYRGATPQLVQDVGDDGAGGSGALQLSRTKDLDHQALRSCGITIPVKLYRYIGSMMVRMPHTPETIERGRRVGAFLRHARGTRSIVEVASAAAISPETLRKIETGRLATPSFATVAAIAAALDISLDAVAAVAHAPNLEAMTRRSA